MNLPVNSTQCLVPGLCPEVATSLIRGLWITTFIFCASATMIGAVLLSIIGNYV